MEKIPTILLLGTSLFLDGVAHFLEMELERKVIRLEDKNAVCQTGFGPLQPDIVVFEMEAMPNGELLRLLGGYPGITWIGLDPECSQVSVYNTHRYATKTLNDLFHVIRKVLPATDTVKGGRWDQ